jgi:Arc/MetJ family transcription regulator
MRKTSVDIDDHLIEQVRRVLGTSSIKETIDSALREVLRVDARRQEIRALAEMDGMDLANKDVMAKAWRS